MLENRKHDHQSLQRQDRQNTPSSLPFRILLAVILFIILILFDKSNTKTAETAIEKFSQAISADVEDKLENWVEQKLSPITSLSDNDMHS